MFLVDKFNSMTPVVTNALVTFREAIKSLIESVKAQFNSLFNSFRSYFSKPAPQDASLTSVQPIVAPTIEKPVETPPSPKIEKLADTSLPPEFEKKQQEVRIENAKKRKPLFEFPGMKFPRRKRKSTLKP